MLPDAVDPADIDETPRKAELPAAYAARVAAEKGALVAARHPGALILSGDTVVAAGRRILPMGGKRGGGPRLSRPAVGGAGIASTAPSP
ncbi:Maf family protein [Sphingobium yanoikuyae]|uniref:Maf family protein n=1 Tax=Sphingobium yanoikuyae TaxID=13690 RepID=UPI00345EB0DA